jgi:hypothetical protein
MSVETVIAERLKISPEDARALVIELGGDPDAPTDNRLRITFCDRVLMVIPTCLRRRETFA